jgi:hypothetical protein
VGDNDGNPDGPKLGVPVSESLGARDGGSVVDSTLGASDGPAVGRRIPLSEGEEDGISDRAMLGTLVDGDVAGDGAGELAGWLEGLVVGLVVVGSSVGEFVGVLDGCDVGELLGG